MEFRDQLDRVVNIPIIPSRIISLVPSQTELLVDLGLREKIVGITKFCSHPHDLRNEKTVVGGTKNVNFDKISDLKPDFILCNKEENSLEMVEKLQTIAPVWITDMYNMEHCKDMILRIGEVFRNEVAKKIVSDIEVVEKDFQLFMKNKNPKSILYLIWKNPYMAAGRSTFINESRLLKAFDYFKTLH